MTVSQPSVGIWQKGWIGNCVEGKEEKEKRFMVHLFSHGKPRFFLFSFLCSSVSSAPIAPSRVMYYCSKRRLCFHIIFPHIVKCT